eukprot:1282078-Pyramimonas_sp.AAC.1
MHGKWASERRQAPLLRSWRLHSLEPGVVARFRATGASQGDPARQRAQRGGVSNRALVVIARE